MTARRTSAALLLLACLAFISLGLPDALLGVAWPSMRGEFALSQALLGAPLALSAVAYFLSGLLAGRLMKALGVGLLLAGSTAIVAAGVMGTAAAPAFALVLLAAPIWGFGSGAIDSALNAYAASHFRPKHVSWLHAAYAAGATAGPALMTLVLARGLSWRAGYAVVGAVLVVLVIVFVPARHRWRDGTRTTSMLDAPGQESPFAIEHPPANVTSALRSPTVWLQIAIFFVYTGLEVAAGQWSFTLLTESRGLDEAVAGTWVSAYWGGILIGRIVLGFAVERVGQVRLLRLATVGVVLGAALFAIPSGWAAFALPVLSFSLASIYPGLMSETPRRVGERLAPHSVGFQVSAATLGFAVVPTLAGVFAERFGLEAIGWLLGACAVLLLVLHERLVAMTRDGIRFHEQRG